MVEKADTNLDAGLAGRRVLVTAGAAGIGLAVVERLMRHGARVLVCDVVDATLQAFRTSHKQGYAVKADVSSEADVERMFEAIKAELGAEGIKDMGKVMAELKARHGSQLDMSKASGLVKAALA